MNLRRRTLVSFAVFGLAIVLFVAGWSWARSRPRVLGAPAPFRSVLEWNGRIWGDLFGPGRRAPEGARVSGEPRQNGDIGLETEIDVEKWKLEVVSVDGRKSVLRMEELRKLPRTETTFNFKCIEGWSEIMSFAGVKFSDFLFAYGLDPDVPYVGLETPDGAYYVSLDMASMLHPQTLLVYEMNGRPLAPENGAPLRLATSVKYGIKSLKRIGKIFFSRERPRDYWNEQGYDWFSGL